VGAIFIVIGITMTFIGNREAAGFLTAFLAK
jgi:hypothetical protein